MAPTIPMEIGRGRLRYSERRPIFGKYVFVQADLNDKSWSDINEVPGMRCLVQMGRSRPQPLRRDAVERVQLACQDTDDLPAPGAEMMIGQMVHILGGTWEDFASLDGDRCEIVDIKRAIAWVTVRIFNQPHAVPVPLSHVMMA